MKVLALTHAHLNKAGLSPVSCERADSIVYTWTNALGWDIDIVHTSGTNWPGIWPMGVNLNARILNVEAPGRLLLEAQPKFASLFRSYLKQGKPWHSFKLLIDRLVNRVSGKFLRQNFLGADLKQAKDWGIFLSGDINLKDRKYDFVFVTVGYGDEYLLQTADVLSQKFSIPIVVDFRDLWSEHHNQNRFSDDQRQIIRQYESLLLKNAALISVPQHHMQWLLEKWIDKPVYYLSHSAYTGKDWTDGKVIDDEFRMLYAGKLYADGPGINMLVDLVRELSGKKLFKSFKVHFFVDDTARLNEIVQKSGMQDHVVVNSWVSPGRLWAELRSAHLLIITDSGVSEHFPIIPTKAFQYAHSGRQILFLSRYDNSAMTEFLNSYHAGQIFTSVEDAGSWAIQLSFDKELYCKMPQIKKVPLRMEVAKEFGLEIERLLNARSGSHTTGVNKS